MPNVSSGASTARDGNSVNNGKALSLNGLTSIDKEVAQELAKYDGNISLNSLTTMDINVAKCFEKYECECDTVSLINLDSIGKEVVLILQTNEKIKLPEKYSN